MKNIELKGLTCFNVNLKVGRSPLSENTKYLILESDPNPDYYSKSNFPPNKEHIGDKHLYFLVKNHLNCFQDIILRNSKKIRDKFNNEMNIYPGYMTFQNNDIPCIRLNTTNADQISFLIKEIKNLGIKLVKDQKVNDYFSLIHFKKYIEFENIEEYVYRDKENPNRYFFKINKKIDFKDFIKGMDKIKNNCNFHLFDFFLADKFYDNEMLDFIGIYSRDCDKSRFGELKREIRKQFY
ncbi:MAG: hypothetical protein ABFR32_09930 [Bacteroidota bacterium]